MVDFDPTRRAYELLAQQRLANLQQPPPPPPESYTFAGVENGNPTALNSAGRKITADQQLSTGSIQLGEPVALISTDGRTAIIGQNHTPSPQPTPTRQPPSGWLWHIFDGGTISPLARNGQFLYTAEPLTPSPSRWVAQPPNLLETDAAFEAGAIQAQALRAGLGEGYFTGEGGGDGRCVGVVDPVNFNAICFFYTEQEPQPPVEELDATPRELQFAKIIQGGTTINIEGSVELAAFDAVRLDVTILKLERPTLQQLNRARSLEPLWRKCADPALVSTLITPPPGFLTALNADPNTRAQWSAYLLSYIDASLPSLVDLYQPIADSLGISPLTRFTVDTFNDGTIAFSTPDPLLTNEVEVTPSPTNASRITTLTPSPPTDSPPSLTLPPSATYLIHGYARTNDPASSRASWSITITN